MKSFATILFLAAALPAAAAAPEPDKAAVPRFPSGVEMVTVDVTVTDKKGHPVTDLTQDEFTILEEGTPQKIETFEKVVNPEKASTTPAPPPVVSSNTAPETRNGRSFVVVFDDMNLTRSDAVAARNALASFLVNGTREGDRVMLLNTGGGAWWTARMESGRQELIDIVRRFDGRRVRKPGQEQMGDWEAKRIHLDHDTNVADTVQRRWQAMGVDILSDQGPMSDSGQAQAAGIKDPSGANGPGMINAYIAMRAQEFYLEARQRNVAVLDTMERALNALTGSRGKKVMVLVSGGFIYDTSLDQYRNVLRAAQRANVEVCFLDARGLAGLPSLFDATMPDYADSRDVTNAFIETRAEAEGAEGIADESGGFTIKNTNDLSGGLNRIAEESRAYYLIGYNPQNVARDGKWRKIQVKIARKGLEVRARKGYFPPGANDNKPLTARQQDDKVHDEFRHTLDSPVDLDQIPLRMSTYVGNETILGKANTTVVVDVDVSRFAFEEKDGHFVDTAEVVLVVSQRETGEFWDRSETVELGFGADAKSRLGQSLWYTLTRDFDLPPGHFQAKIAVRHKKSGRIGSVSHEFEVPDLGKWRVSSLVLTDTLQPRAAGEKPTQPKPLARRTFHPQGMLFGKFEVYGAAKEDATHAPKVSAGYEVLDKDGQVVNKVEPTTIKPTAAGGVSRLFAFRTDGWAPGSYQLVLNVKDEVSGEAKELKEPFMLETGEAAPAAAAPAPAPTAPPAS